MLESDIEKEMHKTDRLAHKDKSKDIFHFDIKKKKKNIALSL